MAADAHQVLGESIVKGLTDKLYEKRKQAANELEVKVKESLSRLPAGRDRVREIVTCLHRDFIASRQSGHRKGGLVGFASVAVACGAVACGNERNEIQHFLRELLPPVLKSLQDEDKRVKYYACEALYNVAKVAQDLVLDQFHLIFDSLIQLCVDDDVDIQNAALVVNGLLQGVVTKHGNLFETADLVEMLANRMKYKNPSIRQLLLSWISKMLPVQEAQMVSYIPHYLGGLLNMLGDQVRDVRHKTDALLCDLLRAVTSDSREKALKVISSTVAILVKSCSANDACARMTALCWLHEFVGIQMSKPPADMESSASFGTTVGLAETAELSRGKSQHRLSEGWMASLPELVGGTLHCIDDREDEIARLAIEMNSALLEMVQTLEEEIPVDALVERMIRSMQERESMAVRTACLQWICMLLEHSPGQMLRRSTLQRLFEPIFVTLALPDEEVVVAALQVLANIMGGRNPDEDRLQDEDIDSDLFSLVTQRLLQLFAEKRWILETRGRLMIRQLCAHLDPRHLFVAVARAIKQEKNLELRHQLVQTFNWILLTATETKSLRQELLLTPPLNSPEQPGQAPAGGLFHELIDPWFHNTVSALALCFWARQDDLALELIGRFAAFEPSMDLLKQLDQLVQLLESPLFSRLRLRLLEPSKHPALVKCILALAMILPQAGAFKLLRERILVVQSGLLFEERAEILKSNASGDGQLDQVNRSVSSRMPWWSESRASSDPQPGTEMAGLLGKLDARTAAAAPG